MLISLPENLLSNSGRLPCGRRNTDDTPRKPMLHRVMFPPHPPPKLAGRFDIEPEDGWVPRFNIAPAQNIPVIREHPEEPKRFGSKIAVGVDSVLGEGCQRWVQDALVAAMSAVSATTSATASTEGSTFALRTGLIHVEGLSSQSRAVQSGNGFIAFGIVAHLNETEPAPLASVPVGRNLHFFDFPVHLKCRPQLVLGALEIEIAHVDVFHSTLVR